MTFIYLTFFTALALAAVAAYFSIVGLMAIFPAAAISIAVMGVVLELGKLVAASWVYRNWKEAPVALRYYFTTAVIILSFITSMGIFGFLSKAHIDHQFSFSDSSIIVKNLEREIQSEEQTIVTAQRSIDILDRLVSEADTKDANFIRNRQKRERENLNSAIRTSSERIKALNTELTPLRQQSAAIEAEVGPIKYVADLIYGESDKNVIEKAVRWVIVILVVVFDPLAIILLIAANFSLKQLEKKPVFINSENIDTNFTEKEDWSPEMYQRVKQKPKVKVDSEKISTIPKEIFDKVFKK